MIIDGITTTFLVPNKDSVQATLRGRVWAGDKIAFGDDEVYGVDVVTVILTEELGTPTQTSMIVQLGLI